MFELERSASLGLAVSLPCLASSLVVLDGLEDPSTLISLGLFPLLELFGVLVLRFGLLGRVDGELFRLGLALLLPAPFGRLGLSLALGFKPGSLFHQERLHLLRVVVVVVVAASRRRGCLPGARVLGCDRRSCAWRRHRHRALGAA